MNSKIIVVLIIVLSCGFTTHAQSDDYDERLLSRYSAERIQELKTSNPYLLDYWTFYLDNSYEIVGLPSDKPMPDLETIELDIDRMNVLDMDIEKDRINGKYYRIEGKKKLLIIHSNKRFIQLFNDYRNSRRQ